MRTALVCTLVWLCLSAPALACSYPEVQTFELRTDEQETEAPAAPHVEVARVKRGTGPERDGCSWAGSSCDTVGYVLLNVEVRREELGYVLEVQGKSPSFARYVNRPLQVSPDGPFHAAPDGLTLGDLRLVWDDGEGQQSYDFDIHVWSVDRSGNMSELPTIVHVESSGADGCAALSSNLHGSWLWSLLLLLFARRRRHGSRRLASDA